MSQLPVKLLIDAALAPLAGRGIYHYIHQEGNPSSGLILLKLSNLAGQCTLLTQQRDFDTDALVWVPALQEETVDENEADTYAKRAMSRDPDLWIIEIEDPAMVNPFE